MSGHKAEKRANIRSWVYGLLSQVYKQEPHVNFLKELTNAAFLQSLKELDIELGEYFAGKPAEQLTEELAVEYTRLFIGPGRHIYPYESAYCGGENSISSSRAAQIKDFIQATGLKYATDFHCNYDHISIELEFMQRLTAEEARLREKGDLKRLARVVKLEQMFINEHLGQWAGKFSEQVIKQASSGFYQAMARLTKEYIMLEAREINHLTYLGGERQ